MWMEVFRYLVECNLLLLIGRYNYHTILEVKAGDCLLLNSDIQHKCVSTPIFIGAGATAADSSTAAWSIKMLLKTY